MRILPIITVIVFCLLSPVAQAGPSAFSFDAGITQIGVTSGGQTTLFDYYDFHGKRFGLGESVSGRVVYGTGTSGNDSNGTSDSILIYSNALQSLLLQVPSASFSTNEIGFNSGLISVSDNLYNFDSILFTQFGPNFTTARIYFDDETGRAFSDFSLPTQFDASLFSYGFAEFSLVDVPSGDRLFVSARIRTAAFETSVPEPTTPGLLAAGSLIMFAMRRRPQETQETQSVWHA